MSQRTMEYDISLDDMIAFNLHHYQASAEMRRVRNLRWFARPLTVLAFIVVMYFVMNPTQHAARETKLIVVGYLIFLVVLAAAWLVFFPRIWRHAIVRAVRKNYLKAENEGYLGHRTLRFDERTIAERGALGETEKPWSAVEKIDVTPHHAFVYVGDIAAFIVPRHAFGAGPAFDEFVETAKRLAGEAKATTGA